MATEVPGVLNMDLLFSRTEATQADRFDHRETAIMLLKEPGEVIDSVLPGSVPSVPSGPPESPTH